MFGALHVLETRGTEEYDGVLHFLAAETREWLPIFGEEADGAAVRPMDERRVLIREGRFRKGWWRWPFIFFLRIIHSVNTIFHLLIYRRKLYRSVTSPDQSM